MNVIDFLKEKGERLTKNRVELFEIINPQMRDYFNEAMNSARNSQWLSWALDQKKVASGTDARSNEEEWPYREHPAVQKTLAFIENNLNQVTYTGDWYVLSQERINQFAEVTEDTQWIHTDTVRAKTESPFRSTIAHGFLTLSMIPKLTGIVDGQDDTLFEDARMVVNLGLNKVRYPYPVKAGSRIRAIKKPVSVGMVRKGLEVTEEITIEIEGLKRPACIAETVVMLVY